jgi:hypothetical protein
VTNLPVKIKKTQMTVVITTKTVTKEQNVPRISILIKRRNIVKRSVLLVVRILVKFHNAESAKMKVRY